MPPEKKPEVKQEGSEIVKPPIIRNSTDRVWADDWDRLEKLTPILEEEAEGVSENKVIDKSETSDINKRQEYNRLNDPYNKNTF